MVMTEHGEAAAMLKGSFYHKARRKSDFYLGGSTGHLKSDYEHVIAANFDYVFIVSSLNMDFNLNRIQRYCCSLRHVGGW